MYRLLLCSEARKAVKNRSFFQVETKTDKKKQFPLTVRSENERYGGQVRHNELEIYVMGTAKKKRNMEER